MTDPTRKAFEDWMREEYQDTFEDWDSAFRWVGCYVSFDIDYRWQGWSAAMARRLEAGFVIVPVEPTKAMIDAHYQAHAEADTVFADPADVWKAMLTAHQQEVERHRVRTEREGRE